MWNTDTSPAIDDRDKKWRCCFCCHVRTATILIGVLRLMFVLGTLFAVLTVLLCPQFLGRVSRADSSVVVGFTKERGPKPQGTGKQSDQEKDNLYFMKGVITTEDLDVSLLLLMGTLVISILLICGAVKGKPSFLMPFLCIEVLSLCVTSLSMLGYCALVSDVRTVISSSPDFPMREELLALDPVYLTLSLVIAALVSLSLKAYCIHIVWRCYQYLIFRQSVMAGVDDTCSLQHEDRLPNYEEAVEAGQKSDYNAPPPPYSAVVLLKPVEEPKSSES